MTAPQEPTSDLAVRPDDVEEAARAIAGAVVRTPSAAADRLSAVTGCSVVVKFENLQPTGSFKDRGALNRLLRLSPEERRRGVVANSAGNHAQALAHHGSRLGIPVTIVMPASTPNVKVERTASLGAAVVLADGDVGAAEARAHALGAERGLVFVHPYDDPAVIAGQGTVALELLADHPDLDIIVVPVGGGGLISGVAVAARARRADVEIVGVQSERYPSMVAALAGREPSCGGPTIAEGIAVARAGTLTTPIVAALVRDVLTVTEGGTEEALNLLLFLEKTVTEGAGATPLAALLEHREKFEGRRVGIVLSGGNIDPRLLAQVVMRGLVRAGQLVTLQLELPDAPGTLARVSAIIGGRGGNIVEVSHHRLFSDVSIKAAVLDVAVETRDRAHLDEIVGELERAGYGVAVRGPEQRQL
jgi:threonine dehydratase